MFGQKEVVQLLHELAPATLSATDEDGQVPAHGAACFGQKEVVQLLHELAPAALSATDKNGMVPAHGAAMFGQKEVVQLLHELAPATLSATGEDEKATRRWCSFCVSLLLQLSAQRMKKARCQKTILLNREM
eukprot:TRINITY_DN1436_c0_g1_i7.p1 TRINITY_DN1436_c0_g1~~TRINITY_DN1436_c0_g1_i7.p1  ORF type:complete len:149 (-),score=54.04 TRINITY_DN1436_c0_g1_i7:85-480(-)